jgi:hypothetical protein
VIEVNYIEFERRTSSGDFDIALSAKVKSDQNIEEMITFLWELKAPQCYIFEKDTENRLKPSKDLISAENQLLHYYHECKHNADFLRTHGITHPDMIYAGGIIIGKESTKVKNFKDKSKANSLFQKINHIRKQYFYSHLSIRIITWDTIFDFIQSNSHTGERKKGTKKRVAL